MQRECPLTDHQIEVVQWLSYGKTYTDIADLLSISRKAIYRRMDRAWVATGTFNKTALVAMAIRRGWIQ